jgi:hypothetical protein
MLIQPSRALRGCDLVSVVGMGGKPRGGIAMKICARCGNQVSSWAVRDCPVCARIEKEAKRFGHYRPGRTYHPAVAGPSSKTTMSSRDRRILRSSPGFSPKAGARKLSRPAPATRHLRPYENRRSPLLARVF